MMNNKNKNLHICSSDIVAVKIPMAEEFVTWCVEYQGKSLQKGCEYVSSLHKVGSKTWNEHLVGLFKDVSEAFESHAGELHEIVGYQIYARHCLENQIEAISWYASIANEEPIDEVRPATYNKWATALRTYCKYLEFLTYQYLERSGFGGEKKGNHQPNEVAFLELERKAKHVALNGGMVKHMDSALTYKQLDLIQMEPFASMRTGAQDKWLLPKPFFPLSDAYKEWLKSQSKVTGTIYNYPSVLNTLYINLFRNDEQWNALFCEPLLLSVAYINSLRSAILLRISEVRNCEKELEDACSIQTGATAAVESYIRFLKSLL